MRPKLISFTLPTHMPGHGGCANGYVALPKGHKFFGLDYDMIHNKLPNLDVHGGLTYAAKGITGQPKETTGMWIVGFDTLHYGDTNGNWSRVSSVKHEADRLLKQLK